MLGKYLKVLSFHQLLLIIGVSVLALETRSKGSNDNTTGSPVVNEER